jgi:hypothetical protein
MGYTHHFKLNGNLTSNVLTEIKEVLGNHNITYEFNSKDPAVVTSDLIRFNGYEDAGYETFALEPGREEFCKTNYKEYDLAVCEVLLVLKHHYGEEFELKSDGFWVDKDLFDNDEFDGYWNGAFTNVRNKFGYTFEIEKVESFSSGRSFYQYIVK